MSIFRDRIEAGQLLAGKLQAYANRPDVIVLALPRGGVPVGYEISQALHVPLDVFLVRKLGVPGQEELALGAIAVGGIRVFNDDILHEMRLSKNIIDRIIGHEEIELERRNLIYRGNAPLPDLRDKIIILVDDGMATGATMQAAVEALKMLHPTHIIVAIPVAARETNQRLQPLVNDLICLQTPTPFYGVGMWYRNFAQTTDDEVCSLLRKNN